MIDAGEAAIRSEYLLERARQRQDMMDTQDLDRAIACAREGLATVSDHEDLALDLRELLSEALMDRVLARVLAPGAQEAACVAANRADLVEATGHLEAVLAATPPADPGREWLLRQLVQAYGWRTELAEDDELPSLADKLAEYGQEAWRLLGPGDPGRTDLGLLLSGALYDRVCRPWAEYPAREVDLMISVLSEVMPQCDVGSGARLHVEVMTGGGLASRGQESGNPADFAAARSLILSAMAGVLDGVAASPVTVRVLASWVSVLVEYDLLDDHLDQAVEVLRLAVANPVGDPQADSATLSDLAGILRSRAFRGGPQGLRDSPDAREAIELFRAAHALAPPGSFQQTIAARELGGALLTRYSQAGVREDLDAAQFYLDAAKDAFAAVPSEELRRRFVHHEAEDAHTMAALAFARGMSGDVAALDEAVDGFQAALAHWPGWHPFAARARNDLATARLLRLALRPDAPREEDLREASNEIRAAAAASAPTSPVALLQARGAAATAALLARDEPAIREAMAGVARARDEVDPGYGERVRFTALLGLASALLSELTRSQADLHDAFSWLEAAHAESSRQPGHPRHADVLSRLAQLRQASGYGRQAVEAGLALLRVRVTDVLLQTGTPRALASARAAADEGVMVARWCLDAGLPAKAAEALELGRGLVLHSATNIAQIPALLTAHGHGDLAREWREQADGPWESGPPEAEKDATLSGLLSLTAGDGLVIPSDLRERVLAALADVAADRLLAAPGHPEIGEALARADADALIYLLAADDGRTVRALLIPAGQDTLPRELQLPRQNVGTLLDDYAKAHAGLLKATSREAKDAARDRCAVTLDPLCAWAWKAVAGPLLAAAPSRLPKLVLIPTGSLSLVPWHAAHHLGEYACTRAVFSYAASARQFIEVSRRGMLLPRQRPVIVADPTSTLRGAIAEAQAIRFSLYPEARYLGPGTGSDGKGNPAEVLTAIPSATDPGASVLHVACHANVAAGNPERSYLLLADSHRLTVTTILRQAAGRHPSTAGGLVCLAACRTDLAAKDYDEALTLATAFLASGATSVIAARWEIPDNLSSVLMFMFHYFLVKQALPQSEALRQAQLWMLDPNRSVPPDARMPSWLAKIAQSSELAKLTSWAGITHQGQL